MIYLDNSATSFVKPKIVKDAVIRALNTLTANPGRSGHYLSQNIAQQVFETREKLKKFFNAPNHEVVFTKNCTEALNLALRGFLKSGDHVITTCYEHNSVLRTLKSMENMGVEVTIMDCSLKDFAHVFEQKIKQNTTLVVTTHVSNVTGEITDVKTVGKLCKKHGINYLVDGAQSCGHLEVDLQNSNITFLTFSGHKGLLSITGVGGLIVKKGTKLNPLIFGGTGTDSKNLVQPTDFPEGYESGTLPTIPIVSLSAGLDFLTKNFNKIKQKESSLSLYTYSELKKLPFVELYSTENSTNVFAFNIIGQDDAVVSNELNEKFNICVRAGKHCSPLIHQKLGTSGAVRVSVDFNNTKKEIDALIFALKHIANF